MKLMLSDTGKFCNDMVTFPRCILCAIEHVLLLQLRLVSLNSLKYMI